MVSIDIMTTSEAAARLGKSADTIRRYCEDGTLDARRWGRLWVVSADSVRREARLQMIRAAHRRVER